MIMVLRIFTKINTKWKNVNDESLLKYFKYLNSDIWKSLLGNNKDQKIEKKFKKSGSVWKWMYKLSNKQEKYLEFWSR